MREKLAVLSAQDLDPWITTQFGFDAVPVLAWLARLRAEAVTVPVQVGIVGPASVKTLLGFAARCGVGTSAKVMAKYGASITKLLTTAGPDVIVKNLMTEFDRDIHGETKLHVYPFGGLLASVDWMNCFKAAQPQREVRGPTSSHMVSQPPLPASSRRPRFSALTRLIR